MLRPSGELSTCTIGRGLQAPETTSTCAQGLASRHMWPRGLTHFSRHLVAPRTCTHTHTHIFNPTSSRGHPTCWHFRRNQHPVPMYASQQPKSTQKNIIYDWPFLESHWTPKLRYRSVSLWWVANEVGNEIKDHVKQRNVWSRYTASGSCIDNSSFCDCFGRWRLVWLTSILQQW